MNNCPIQVNGFPMIDEDKLNQLIEDLDRQSNTDPQDATIVNQEQIVPGEIGYRLYREAFTEQFSTYFFGKGSSKIEIPKEIVYPKVTSELLSHIRAKKIGYYETYYNENDQKRGNNIYWKINASVSVSDGFGVTVTWRYYTK